MLGCPKNKIENNKIEYFIVVPYSAFLLKKYKCHINVEALSSISGIKYIFDYLHKGGDRAFCSIKKSDGSYNVTDEIRQYIDARYLGPMEAAWRLQEFPICEKSHFVVRLPVHTENQQKIVFEENKETVALQNSETHLTAWFNLNKNDEYAKKIKYVNIPNHYVFNYKTKSWVKRQRKQKYCTIGRIYAISPKDSERFHLKLILNHIKGAESFEDLKSIKIF